MGLCSGPPGRVWGWQLMTAGPRVHSRPHRPRHQAPCASCAPNWTPEGAPGGQPPDAMGRFEIDSSAGHSLCSLAHCRSIPPSAGTCCSRAPTAPARAPTTCGPAAWTSCGTAPTPAACSPTSCAATCPSVSRRRLLSKLAPAARVAGRGSAHKETATHPLRRPEPHPRVHAPPLRSLQDRVLRVQGWLRPGQHLPQH